MDLSSPKWRTTFHKKNEAKQALEELQGYTKKKGKFVTESVSPDGTSIVHYDKGVFIKGVIQKRLEEPERLMKEANLGERFNDRTFASFDAKRDREAFDACSRYANTDNLMACKRNGLIIAGGFGSGKTHLAASISRVLVDRGIPVLFGTAIEHLDKIRDDYEHTGINRYLAKLKATPVLVIDDLGKEKKSDWTKQVLFDIVNYRYEHMLPLIVTTNLVSNDEEFDAFANHVEGAVWSRFCEMCRIICTKGTDYRMKG